MWQQRRRRRRLRIFSAATTMRCGGGDDDLAVAVLPADSEVDDFLVATTISDQVPSAAPDIAPPRCSKTHLSRFP